MHHRPPSLPSNNLLTIKAKISAQSNHLPNQKGCFYKILTSMLESLHSIGVSFKYTFVGNSYVKYLKNSFDSYNIMKLILIQGHFYPPPRPLRKIITPIHSCLLCGKTLKFCASKLTVLHNNYKRYFIFMI